MNNRIILISFVFFQVICAVFFIAQILNSIFGLTVAPIDWHLYELIEIGAALGLILGLIFGGAILRQALRRTAKVEDALRAASGAFMDVLDERFAEWHLTPAERDVALFAIKGMSTQEIAELRAVSEGTIKAQTAAIYRKAGVSGRPQLLSLFIDEMMQFAPETVS